MRAAIIINPTSGRGAGDAHSGESRADHAARLARRAGVDIEVALTTGRGHGAELARSFATRGYTRVIAWGGDGTINEIAGPLVGSETMMGIVPAGSGDGCAHGLGLPRETDQALIVALTGSGRRIDVGYLGDRHFLNIGGIGFDAAVASRFNRRAKRGAARYVLDSLQTVWSYRCHTYDLTVEGQRLLGPRFLIAFANGREYGNGLVLVPNASPVDGRLDLVVVNAGSPLRQCWRARRLGWRPLAPAEGVTRDRITRATVTGARLQCHVDGETFEAEGTLDVRIAAGSLTVAGVSG